MKSLTSVVLFVLFVAPTSCLPARAAEVLPDSLEPFYTASPPEIDGRLDDDLWQRPPTVSGHFVSYWPHQGEELPFLTEVWVARTFDGEYFDLSAGIQATGWLRVDLYSRFGDRVYYHPQAETYQVSRSVFFKASYRWRH